MFFHLVFLATTVLRVLANEAHIASLGYSSHNDWGCTSEYADSQIYRSGDSRTLLQNFDYTSIAWPLQVPTSSSLCTMTYNITLDEPGRVVLNKKSTVLMGAVRLESFATVAVVVAYRWIEPNITVSFPCCDALSFYPPLRILLHGWSEPDGNAQTKSKFTVPGPITLDFTSTANISEPVVSSCGGGVLEVMMRSQIYSSLNRPTYYSFDDPTPGERIWRLLTSLDVEKC